MAWEGARLANRMNTPSPATVIRTAFSSGHGGSLRSSAARNGTASTTPTSISGCTSAMDPILRATACSTIATNETRVAANQTGLLVR